MNQFLPVGVTAMLLTAVPANAETLVVGLDVSSSNPLILDSRYAADKGNQIAQEVNRLAVGDTVVVETFGAHGSASTARLSITLSNRIRPDKAAAYVRAFVAKLPGLVSTGKLQPAGETNIVSFLRTRAGRYGCTASHYVVVTDGRESSDVVDEQALMDGRATLPAASSRWLNGCRVRLLGVGQGVPSRVSFRLAQQWQSHLRSAGARSIQVQEE